MTPDEDKYNQALDRIAELEAALRDIADGRMEGFTVGEDSAVYFLQERARKVLRIA